MDIPAERTLAGEVDTDLMMRHLAEFARWTKLSGSAEEAESLRYVEKQMALYGYSTQILHHPAYISLPGPARVVTEGQTLRAITHSMSQSSPPEGTRGRLVHVGSGTDAEFAGKDVRGAIVLVDGMATPPVALRASQAGAVGQLHISSHEHLHEMCISPVWGSPDTRTMALLPSTVAVTISLADGAALRERLARGDEPQVVLHAEVDTGWRPTPILVADMAAPDADETTPFVLFSGHHDTWYQGVMDNGSANATMMEVARLSAEHRRTWRRNLRFCFWSGHSHGRYSGSSWYADEHWHELESRCAIHVNVDSTGGIGALNLAEAPAATELAGLAGAILATEAGETFPIKRLGRNSDQSFWGIGIPSIFGILSTQADENLGLRNSLGWWWHTPEDLIDKIDPALLARDTRIYRALLTRVLTDPVLPIDIAAQVGDLQTTVQGINVGDDSGMSLAGLLSEIAELRAGAASLSGKAKGLSGAAARQHDQLLMRLSRALVPIDYTTGARFAHDPALPQGKWPALDPIRRFAAEPKDSGQWYPLQIEARRARNMVMDAVRRARRELDQSLS
ncbi:aminopeptidase [Bosea caraganae]|uniref:Aminopeptidase n=1 Tax=Bosea caraganae TaxID=2763117 RepID=A0A370KZ94_9HYPH|nr:M28 family peptidase [Bosea caraganae]RDJ19932.1 aminopeptidase [Bosea caraganae]RDJ23870.1 aminopeptidase [Bosea caraganae]